MVSLCLIYSNDRLSQLKQTIAYLNTIPECASYNKIIISDGPSIYAAPGFTVIEVPRTGRFVHRAEIWAAAIAAGDETIILMDCDRIPHRGFFKKAGMVPENTFLYCDSLYQLSQPVSDAKLLEILDSPDDALMKPDFRVTTRNGTIRAAKTPMSGCVAFKKSTYLATSGVSRQYRGWGFSDTDFYMTAYFAGCVFESLNLPELHLNHGYTVSQRVLVAMNLLNGIRFYDKWFLPVHQDIVGIAESYKMSLDFVRGFTLDDFIEYVETHD